MRRACITIPFSTQYMHKPMLSIALSASFADLDLFLDLPFDLDLNFDLAKNPRLCVSVSAGQACGNKRPRADTKRGHGTRESIMHYEYLLRVFPMLMRAMMGMRGRLHSSVRATTIAKPTCLFSTSAGEDGKTIVEIVPLPIRFSCCIFFRGCSCCRTHDI